MAGRDVSAPEQIKHYNLEVFDRSDDDGEFRNFILDFQHTYCIILGKNLRELHLKFKAPIDEDRNTPVARYDMRIMASHPKDRTFLYKWCLGRPLTYISVFLDF